MVEVCANKETRFVWGVFFPTLKIQKMEIRSHADQKSGEALSLPNNISGGLLEIGVTAFS